MKNSKINKIKVSEKRQKSRYPSLRKTHETGYRRNLRKKIRTQKPRPP